MTSLMRAALAAAVGVALARGESGTTPKPKPTDYPVQVEAPGMTLAAEYLLTTIAHARQSFVVRDHLVIEVAVYPAKGQRVKVSSGVFTLRMNGKSNELATQTPEMVAAALRYADWESPGGLEVGAGPIILGRQTQTPRFPGDRRDQDRRPPGTVDVQQSGDPSKALTGPEAAVEWAFPDGEHGGPVSGFVYFAYRGKTKKIRSLELVFRGAEQPVVLKLF